MAFPKKWKFRCFHFKPEAVPSINYIGRQLDVSYIGRQVYGESIYLSDKNLAWDIMRHLAANISSPKVRELHDHYP